MEEYKNLNEWIKENESSEKHLEEIHGKELGLGVPDDYFSKSKNDILDSVFHKRESKVVPLFRNKTMWFAAAGLALILALSVFKPSVFSGINDTPLIIADSIDQIRKSDFKKDAFYFEEDILLTSLFIDDSEIDDYVDNYIIEETLIDEYIDHFLLDDLFGESMLYN